MPNYAIHITRHSFNPLLVTAAATAAVSVTMTVAMLMLTAAAGMFYAIIQLHFFHTAALGASQLIAVFAAFGAGWFFPDMAAVNTFKYAIFHNIIPSLDNYGPPLYQSCRNLGSGRVQNPLKCRSG